MTREQLRQLKGWFAAYVRGFGRGDSDLRRNLELKARHTHNVCREIRLIARESGFGQRLTLLAESAALLHDVGRFEQYARYRTFSDRESEDHGALGLRILEESGALRPLAADERDLVVRAITHHNKPAISPEEEGDGLVLARLLRDADKLDILRLVAEYYHQAPEERNDAVAVGLPDTPGWTPRVLEQLEMGMPVRSSDLVNVTDMKLFQIGWVYDLNFPAARAAVKRRRYLENIALTLPDHPALRRAVARAMESLGEGPPRP
jgi:hypothetical protein